jgi:hypothetical protein
MTAVKISKNSHYVSIEQTAMKVMGPDSEEQ